MPESGTGNVYTILKGGSGGNSVLYDTWGVLHSEYGIQGNYNIEYYGVQAQAHIGAAQTHGVRSVMGGRPLALPLMVCSLTQNIVFPIYYKKIWFFTSWQFENQIRY